MFITENQNIGDSVLFLLASREALANIVEATGSENSEELVKFIYTEASDYEVMHLLLNGTLPEEKYSDYGELELFSALKESMLMNKDFVVEITGEEIFDNIINEVDSVYPLLSTAAPVLEFASFQDPEIAVAKMISEAGPAGMAVSRFKRITTAAKAPSMRNLGGASKAPTDYIARGKYLAKHKLAAANKWAATKASAAKTAVTKGAAAVKGAATKGAAAVGKFAGTKAGMATGGAAAAALAIYAGYKIYKRFFSQAAKACAGMSGAAKTACMNKYKKQAIMKQAAAIQSASASACAKSKDPAKCKAGVAKKVQALKAKAAKIAA